MTRASAVALLGLFVACGGDPPGEAAVFPADYAASYVRVYPCRPSIEHFLHNVAIWADPVSAESYRQGRFPLPNGSVIVKEEFADEGCQQRLGWTAMQRSATGADAGVGSWTFQELDPQRRVVELHPHRNCISCHAACDSRLARDGTCIEP